MRALVMDRIGGPLEVREVPDVTAPAGGVVIEVKATGLCRSDWHAWAGHDDIALPHVPGHEFAGVVHAVGEGVTRWSAGDRVTAPFVEGCGVCAYCLSGNAQVCPDQEQPGFTHWGSFADLVVVHAADANVVAIPESVSFAAAASLGCRFATAYRALTGRARTRAGEWVSVYGAGGVGLSAVMIAKALGAKVIAVDRNQGALDLATGLGADHVLNSARLVSDADAPARVHEITGGGAHVSLDAVGLEVTSQASVFSLRRLGRHVQAGLLPTATGLSPMPMARAIGWELEILGTHGMSAQDYPAMLALVESGRLAPQRLIERTVSLAEAAALLPVVDTLSPAGMTVIDPAL